MLGDTKKVETTKKKLIICHPKHRASRLITDHICGRGELVWAGQKPDERLGLNGRLAGKFGKKFCEELLKKHHILIAATD